MTARLKFLCLFALLLLGIGAASGDGKLYRWTDSQGHVHYGDQPAPNAREVPAARPAPADAAVRPRNAAASSAETTSAVSPDDCQRKKDLLASYRNATKINETNSLGEVREYSEEQRQRLIDATERAVQAACNPG